MTVQDWTQILEYIKKKGFLGCLKFTGSKNDKKFAGIDSNIRKNQNMYNLSLIRLFNVLFK